MVIDIGFCTFIGICSGVAVIVSNLGKRQREPFVVYKADFYFEDVYLRYAAQKNPKDLSFLPSIVTTGIRTRTSFPRSYHLWNAITFKNIFGNIIGYSVKKHWRRYIPLLFLGMITI